MTELYHNADRNPSPRRKQFPPAQPGYKFCYACEIEKNLDAFRVWRQGALGVRPRCIECERIYDSERRRNYERPDRRENPRNKPKRKATEDGYKFCNDCEQDKLIQEFHHRNNKPLGICILCERDRDRARNVFRRIRKTPQIPKATKPGYKVCNTCWKDKRHSEFSKDPAQKDGYKGRCIACHANKWENRPSEEKTLERERRRQLNEAKRAAKNANDQRVQKEVKSHLLSDYKSMKHAIKNGAYTEKVSYQHILERDGYFCYICEQTITPYQRLAFDHFIPLIPRPGEPQGSHTEDNIRVTHFECNSRKSNRSFESLTPFDRRGI